MINPWSSRRGHRSAILRHRTTREARRNLRDHHTWRSIHLYRVGECDGCDPGGEGLFRSKNIGPDQLSAASGRQLPLGEAPKKQRATRVGEQFGQITPSPELSPLSAPSAPSASSAPRRAWSLAIAPVSELESESAINRNNCSSLQDQDSAPRDCNNDRPDAPRNMIPNRANWGTDLS